MIRVYTQEAWGQDWLAKYRGQKPLFACVLGFTDTALIPGISAAGATPEDRLYTAIADGEFLVNGVQSQRAYPLPPLTVGVSPVFISRAIIEALALPVYLFNAGLPQPPAVKYLDLGGIAAQCLTGGQAIPLKTVKFLFQQGLDWGKKLASLTEGYLLISECVVGGTTTALALLTGLGISAMGKVNSSHPDCNHTQKQQLVQEGIQAARIIPGETDPFAVVAGVGDPMQIVVAGMVIAASCSTGVLLAGGTQMIAVYALIQALAARYGLLWQPKEVVVGTTPWVADDPSGDTVGLAKAVGDMTLMGSQLSFAQSSYTALRAYEQGFVKEGVGAGGSAIAISLYRNWSSREILAAVEALVEKYYPKIQQ